MLIARQKYAEEKERLKHKHCSAVLRFANSPWNQDSAFPCKQAFVSGLIQKHISKPFTISKIHALSPRQSCWSLGKETEALGCLRFNLKPL